MPFTPYHFGPSGFIGLLFRKWLDVPVIVATNVLIDIEVIVDAMQIALSEVISAEVTTATRSVMIDGIQVQEGQLIGLLDGKLVVSGDDLDTVVRELLHKAHADEHELITLYHGSNVSSMQAQTLMDVLSQEFDQQEVVAVGPLNTLPARRRLAETTKFREIHKPGPDPGHSN